MTAEKPSQNRAANHRSTRRQFLKWMPAVAGAAALGPNHVTSARTVLPQPDLQARQPAGTMPASLAFDMPFRTRGEAARAGLSRRLWEERRGATQAPTQLERLLPQGSLVDSRLALANWHLMDETEDLNLGNFRFPISPFNIGTDDGKQQFLLFSNTEIVSNFRHRDYLEQVHRRIFDRAVWAMDSGRMGTAVVEFDRAFTDQKAERIVRLLTHYGVRTIVWGNELNDPSTPWRDDLPALFDLFTTATRVIREQQLQDVQLCLPGLAFYAWGEYLQKMLRTFRELQRQRFPKNPDAWPVQRMADHYYGAVDDLLPRIQIIKGILSSEGMSSLKYDLTEVGDPTLMPGQVRASDQQLAEGFIPQISALAVSSSMVDRIVFYSLLDVSNQFSFTSIEDGRLVKRPTYQSFVVTAKLLSRLRRVALSDEKELVRLEGFRSDGIDFAIVWSKLSDRDIWLDLYEGQRAFDALGNDAVDGRPNQIVLRPRPHPALGGPARIILGRRRTD